MFLNYCAIFIYHLHFFIMVYFILFILLFMNLFTNFKVYTAIISYYCLFPYFRRFSVNSP